MEQKNWARVRELVGYYRYELDALFTNYLLPHQKLLSKERHGAKAVKNTMPPHPHQRAARHANARKHPVISMNAQFKRLKLAALSRQMALTGQLEALSRDKAAPRDSKINTWFS